MTESALDHSVAVCSSLSSVYVNQSCTACAGEKRTMAEQKLFSLQPGALAFAGLSWTLQQQLRKTLLDWMIRWVFTRLRMHQRLLALSHEIWLRTLKVVDDRKSSDAAILHACHGNAAGLTTTFFCNNIEDMVFLDVEVLFQPFL